MTLTETRVLAIIRAAILAGEPMPLNKSMAVQLDCGDAAVEVAVMALVKSGKVQRSRIGNFRVMAIAGLGQTASVSPRNSTSPDDVEARRVDNWSCDFCGTRNCTKHGPARITTGRMFSHYSVGAQ